MRSHESAALLGLVRHLIYHSTEEEAARFGSALRRFVERVAENESEFLLERVAAVAADIAVILSERTRRRVIAALLVGRTSALSARFAKQAALAFAQDDLAELLPSARSMEELRTVVLASPQDYVGMVTAPPSGVCERAAFCDVFKAIVPFVVELPFDVRVLESLECEALWALHGGEPEDLLDRIAQGLTKADPEAVVAYSVLCRRWPRVEMIRDILAMRATTQRLVRAMVQFLVELELPGTRVPELFVELAGLASPGIHRFVCRCAKRFRRRAPLFRAALAAFDWFSEGSFRRGLKLLSKVFARRCDTSHLEAVLPELPVHYLRRNLKAVLKAGGRFARRGASFPVFVGLAMEVLEETTAELLHERPCGDVFAAIELRDAAASALVGVRNATVREAAARSLIWPSPWAWFLVGPPGGLPENELRPLVSVAFRHRSRVLRSAAGLAVAGLDEVADVLAGRETGVILTLQKVAAVDRLAYIAGRPLPAFVVEELNRRPYLAVAIRHFAVSLGPIADIPEPSFWTMYPRKRLPVAANSRAAQWFRSRYGAGPRVAVPRVRRQAEGGCGLEWELRQVRCSIYDAVGAQSFREFAGLARGRRLDKLLAGVPALLQDPAVLESAAGFREAVGLSAELSVADIRERQIVVAAECYNWCPFRGLRSTLRELRAQGRDESDLAAAPCVLESELAVLLRVSGKPPPERAWSPLNLPRAAACWGAPFAVCHRLGVLPQWSRDAAAAFCGYVERRGLVGPLLDQAVAWAAKPGFVDVLGVVLKSGRGGAWRSCPGSFGRFLKAARGAGVDEGIDEFLRAERVMIGA
jgi:hypothetical protein